jgi:hypothetical protein
MALVTATANKVLDLILRNVALTPPTSIYLSLHTADPGDTGANEVSGGSYARQQITMSAASGKATSNSGDITFNGMPACTATHVGIWGSVSGGTIWLTGILTLSRTIEAGDSFKISLGDLDIGLA